MRKLRNFFQHVFNPQHFYCRLMDCGLSSNLALRVSAVWEWVYRRPRVALVALATGLVIASCATSAQAKHVHPEHWYQAIWCSEQGGAMETVPRAGLRVDCETDTHAIEFDFAPKWAESVGQALAYAEATGKHAGIVLILERPGDARFLDKLKLAVAGAAAPIDVWTMGPGVPVEAGHAR